MLAIAATLTASAGLISKLASDRQHNAELERRDLAAKETARAASKRKAAAEQYEESKRKAELQTQEEVSGAFNMLLTVIIPFYGLLLYLYFAKEYDGLALLLTAGLAMFIGMVIMEKVRKRSREEITVLEPSPALELEMAKPSENLTGTWIKDAEASESMAEVIEMVQLNRLVRTALKLMKGVQIVQTSDMFEFAIFSLVGWFKVREDYSLTGEKRMHKRRDLRRGQHSGRVIVNRAGHLCIELEWSEPHGGTGVDEFWLHNHDTLYVKSTCTMAGKTAGYLTVYTRRKH